MLFLHSSPGAPHGLFYYFSLKFVIPVKRVKSNQDTGHFLRGASPKSSRLAESCSQVVISDSLAQRKTTIKMQNDIILTIVME